MRFENRVRTVSARLLISRVLASKSSGAGRPASNGRGPRFVVGLLVGSLLCFVMTAFAVRGGGRWSDSSRGAPMRESASATTVSAAATAPADAPARTAMPSVSGGKAGPQQVSGGIQTEVITIRRTGIEPGSISRPQGRVLFLIANRSGLDEVKLKLERVLGPKLREAVVSKQRADWRIIEDLTPGDYILTETTHPGWACHITITPK